MEFVSLVVILLLLLPCSLTSKARLFECGDIQLGGMFSIHYSLNSDLDNPPISLSCEESYQHSVLLVEAMIFAIKEINQDMDILKDETHGKISLGYDILGSCDSSPENMFYAVKAFTNLEMKLADDEVGNGTMVHHPRAPICNRTDNQYDAPIAAMIGPPTTAESSAISSLFRLYNIPVISYDASSPELANHERFPSFFRTIYGDDKQAEALVYLVNQLDWKYIAVIGSDDTVGKQGVSEFKEHLTRGKKCVAKEAYFGMETKEDELVEIVDSLKHIEREEGGNVTANVTLLFMGYGPAVRFLTTAQQRGLNETTWIAVDDWISNMTVGRNPEETAYINLTGTLATQLPHKIPTKFQGWISGFLEPRFFQDTWLFDYFCQRCSNQTDPDENFNCTVQFLLHEDHQECVNRINPAQLVADQRRISNVIMAVYAAAYALHDMMKNGSLTRDPRTGEYWVDYDSMLTSLNDLSTDMPALDDDKATKIEFDENGNLVNANYDIMSYTERNATLVTNYKVNGQTSPINQSLIHWKTGHRPQASCSDPCAAGFRIILGPLECCWKCEKCPVDYYTKGSDPVCYKCPEHHHTANNQSLCLNNTLTYIKLGESLGIINAVFSVFGQLAVLISAITVIKYRKHPIFSDKYTLKTACLLNCALGYTYFVYHTIPPDVSLCSIRRVMWQVSVTAQCAGGFCSISLGRELSKKFLRLFKIIPEKWMPLLGYFIITILSTILYIALVFLFPPYISLTDLGPVTGERTKTYSDCSDSNQPLLLGLSALLPGSFWIVTIFWTFRVNQKRKQNRIIHTSRLERDSAKRNEQANKSKIDHMHIVSILYSSYVTLLIVGALAPIYATMGDPWSRNFLLLMGGFTANTAILGFFILPKAKNVIFDQYLGISRSDSMGGVYIVSGGNMHRIGNQ